MDKCNKSITGIFARYIFMLVLGLGNLAVFYFLFTTPTIRLSFYFLNLISPGTQLMGTSIFFNSILVKIIPACIAGSAYYLLTILAFSIPNIKIIKRVFLVLFLYSSFFILNVARIVLFSTLTTWNLFEIAHLVGWYFISTALVVGLWFLAVRIFKIKSFPVYTDFKLLASKTKKKSVKKAKNTKRSKKN